MTLAGAGEWGPALVYVIGSNVVGLVAVVLGATLAQRLWR
jgi:fluoride ion exporter CrcB/FEX